MTGERDLLFRQAFGHHKAGRLGEAEALYRRVLTEDPNNPEALHLLGVLGAQLGRNDAAVELIGAAVRLRPGIAEYHNDLGLALAALGRLDEAVRCCETALRLKPDHRQAYNNLGNIEFTRRRYGSAAHHYRRALERDPDYVEARANLSVALTADEKLDEAEHHCREALRLNPSHVFALNNLGDILRNRGRFAEAEAAYRQGLARAPNLPVLHYNLGNLLLLTGQFEAGQAEYEWRNLARGATPRFPETPWLGEALEGRTLLLTAEQGAGDAIFFCRYAPRVARPGHVLLETPPSLLRLFSTLPGVELVAAGTPLPTFDLHCPLPTLPFAFGTRLETIPGEVPYLKADPDLVAAWRARLDPLPGRRVGLVWAGNPGHQDDRRRSLAPAALDTLADIPGISFVSLQKDAAAQPNLPLADWTAELTDFADTAALVEALDLVISVDTSVAHLAGALGKPVWLLNRFDPHWIWLLEREDCPWYPTLRQFRQASPGDWVGVIEAVAASFESAKQSS